MGHSPFEFEPIIELPKPPEPPKPSPKKPFWGWLLLGIGVAVIAIFAVLKIDEIADWEGDDPVMNQKRQRQMEKVLKDFDQAEQYALVAEVSGYYPCLKCSQPMIYLNAGEIWKYGVTRHGEEGRYSQNFLQSNKLRYVVEFRGTIGACLFQERVKLFNYPYLPENKRRKKEEMLVLPPGNLRLD